MLENAAKSKPVSVRHQESPGRKTKKSRRGGDERLSRGRAARLKLPRLYEKQRRFVEDPARYTLCEAGTKSGKTLGCAVWLVSQAWEEPGTVWWWVAPSYAQAMVAFELMIHGDRMNAATNKRRGGAVGRLLAPGQDCSVRRGGAFPEIALRNGTSIQFRTAAEPDRLYGSGVTGAVAMRSGYRWCLSE